jgi:hypothetical protein
MVPDEQSLPTIVVMVPVAGKDLQNLAACVHGIRQHSRNPVATIYVIGAAHLRNQLPAGLAVEWIDEESVHPRLDEVRLALLEDGYRHNNSSWYFQQLLKLYAFSILEPVADYILVHDADVALVKDTLFVDSHRRTLLAYGYPLHWRLNTRRYTVPTRHSALSAAARLVPDWKTVDAYSGMQHHIVLDRSIAQELFRRVEDHHDVEFWRAFIRCVERDKWHGISEYVIYRHFAVASFPEAVRSRHLASVDIIESTATGPYELVEALRAGYPSGACLVGCHKFSNYEVTLATMDYIPPELRERLLRTMDPLVLWLDRGMLHIEVLDRKIGLPGPVRLFHYEQNASVRGTQNWTVEDC